MGSRDDYVDALKSSFVTLGTNAALTALSAEAPWLNLPIIRSIARFFVGRVLRIVADTGETAVFFLYIDIRVNKQAKDFEFAAYANHEAQLNGTKEQKIAAEKLLFEKFVAFASLKS